VRNSALFLVSLALIALATPLALANPKQCDNVMSLPSVVRVSFASDCNGIACRSTKRTRPSADPPAAGWATRMFIRRDCLEPAEGDAYFDDLAAYRSPPYVRGELLLGEDCGLAGDDDAGDRPDSSALTRPGSYGGAAEQI
jgi:hypothetical protein